MTEPHDLVALVTLLALLTYLWTGMNVAGHRRRHGIAPPAMSGAPEVERALRVQGNTLEWLALFLPGLWLFALYWSDAVAAGLGVVWIVGRLLYAFGYMKEANARYPGFGVQAAATFILLIGALIGVVRALLVTGGV
jgi:glutathione S-transferase